MKKVGVLVLISVCMLVLASIFASAAYERFECDPEKVGVMRAERNCDNTGDAEEDIALAQRACYDYARLCTPKWTTEQLETCKRIAEKTCLELNEQPPLKYEEYEASEGFKAEDVEKRETVPDVEVIKEEAKKEVAEEMGQPVEEEAPPAPEPTPAPEPAPVEEEKGMGATVWIVIIVIIILVVLWYFMKSKKPAKKKKKK